ncbi:RNA polymerase II transcription factor SIII subunit A-domain-containing protein [Delphinella strobiligena]|nr:RNA polymerase II transcription factor SIII subunit A-domain-containing protein [Delphinella strobiligena]
MVASLVKMCQEAAMKNVADIRDVGEIRYEVVKPILKKIVTPAQLHEIERACPQIAEDDAELWHAFIKRDIPNGDRKILENTPKRPTKWYKVYLKLRQEDQEKQDAAEEILKAALNKRQVEKESNSTQIIHTVIPQGKKPVWSAPRAAPSGLQALRNAKTTADRLTILRRQTATRQAGRAVTQSIPTHELQQKRSVVRQAPSSMVRQYAGANIQPQRPQQQIPRPNPAQPQPRTVFTSHTGAMKDRDRAINAAIRQEREEKEKRLRALTAASASRPAASTPAQSASRSAQPASRPLPKSPPKSAPQPMRKRPAVSAFMPQVPKKRKT